MSAVVGIVSAVGLYAPGFYQQESINWQAQSMGQDLLDLFMVTPVLLICAALAYGGSRPAKFIWAGANLFLVYTFTIYCFDVHFNSMFYFYCICLCLSFYSFLYFLYSELMKPDRDDEMLSPKTRVIGVYFITISILFYILWLSDVVTSILYDTSPDSLSLASLPTNPVHVLDLAIILPALCLTGILLFRQHRIGFLLAPVMLVFTLLMNVTIGGLNLIMHYRGLETNWMITGIMFGLAVFNFILLLSYWKVEHHGQSHLHAA